MKTRTTFILSFTVILTLAAGSAFGKYSGGTGESDDPYRIASASDLTALAADANDYGEAFILVNDIDLAGVTMNTVGNYTVAFTGVFDGNDHVIRNLVINTPGSYWIGLFGYLGPGGQVKNLGVVDANVHGATNVGCLVGYSEGTITSCYATGAAVCTGTGNGGLVGYVWDGSVTSSYAAVDVTSGSTYAGGLAGINYSDITNCYATGSVHGTVNVGGLVGFNGYSNAEYNGTISYCYSAGEVNGTNYVGGLVGLNGADDGAITASFWDVNASGQDASAGGTGETTAEMQTQSTFTDAGWDFVGETANGPNDIWKMPSAGGYPILSWQKEGVAVPLDFHVIKCTVTAGSKSNSDAISFSGTIDANADDFNDANKSSDANFVKVTISDVNAEDMDPCVFSFPVNSKTWKKGKFSSTITSKPLKMSFAFDTKKKTFSFSASNVDLTGLSCPVIVTIQIGSSSGSVSLDETIVNGPKKLIPYQLLMGAENWLAADKASLKRSSKPDADSLTVSGRFTITTGDLSNPMVITVGSQTFTVPGDKFLVKNGVVVSCSKAVSNEGPLVTAKLDYAKCTFTISVKNASITQTGVVDFGINCFGANLDGLETIDLGP
jgi:hypothetical protein